MLDEVLDQIGRRQKFILTSHARPDGDAVGSALACCQMLRSMGKQANVVLSDGVPGIYRPLPFSESVLRTPEQAPDAEAAIILECDSVQRTGLAGLDRHYLINIDHHATARRFADVNWIDPSACSTAEMIFSLARKAGVNVSPRWRLACTPRCSPIPVPSASTAPRSGHSCWRRSWCAAAQTQCASPMTCTSPTRSPRCGCWTRAQHATARWQSGMDACGPRRHAALPCRRRGL